MRQIMKLTLVLTVMSGMLAGCFPFHKSNGVPSDLSQNEPLKKFANGITIYGMRKFPYPYKAMLAIASDSDHQTLRKYNLIHQFLNTTEMTPMGRGVGLDISDSFFMYNGSNLPKPIDISKTPIRDELSYFKGTTNQPYAKRILDHYIRVGWMDTIHTFGDFSMVNQHQTKFTRQLAVQAIQALKAAGSDVSVWIDHGNQSNVDNFGSYGIKKFYNYQQGANPKSPYYHTDLTIPYGVKFIWPDLNSGRLGFSSIIYPVRLPDGRTVWGFARYSNEDPTQTGNWSSPEWLWSVDHLAAQITYQNLQSLVWQRQYAIIAQHFASDNEKLPLPKNAVQALQLLAKQQKDGDILVARTSRLLQYNLAQEYLRYRVYRRGGKAVIDILTLDDPVLGAHLPSMAEIRGATFYTSNPRKTVILLGGKAINPGLIQYNPKDTYAPSIGIKWFPPDTHDYTMTLPGVK